MFDIWILAELMKLQLDWSAYENAGMGDAYADIPKQGGDFGKAVAVCIASRQCERDGKGVMCPSFRISQNPLLSPGGRVKLLKSALNADSDSPALFSPELAEAMSLCVSCKGCQRECENAVDMATIKAEYLAQVRKKNGLSLRSRLFANLPKLLNWPLTATLISWRNRSRLISSAGRRLGIAPQMRLPSPQAAFRAAAVTLAGAESRPEVVLFVDTFNRHFHPQAAQAALDLLSAAQYTVFTLSNPAGEQQALCCGRTYFANGMIPEARHQAHQLLAALQPHIEAGRWIIGLEPSCILSLRDEYLKLGLGPNAPKLAERVFLLEEFIAREQTAQRWPLAFTSNGQRLLVHGHCHQKAVGAMKSMRKVLKSVAGLDFELVETSCCGMAGHFGLESEHYAQAQEMAEQALFPALRAEPEAGIIANGFSCQLQIDHGGFGPARHIAELLYAAIAQPPERADEITDRTPLR